MDAPRPPLRFAPGQPHWWQWLTVLSLDAPLVAVAWQAALARAARVSLHAYHGLILGAAVWLAYAADRWTEGWRLAPESIQTQRHWFYREWRWSVAIVWGCVLTSVLRLSLARLTPAEWTAGLLLLGPVVVYLLSHQLIHRTHRWRVPKEICVAVLLAGGVACFPAAGRPSFLAETAVPLFLFGLLCFANCTLISHWEDEVDRLHDQTSLALQYPGISLLFRALPWFIAVLGATLQGRTRLDANDVTWCAAVSGALLAAIDLVHERLGRQLSRVLADVALMTPFLSLAVDWFSAG